MAYICRKGCECHRCDSFRYDDERMDYACFGKIDEEKAYKEQDYKKLVDLSGLKPDNLARYLKLSKQTLLEKLEKRTFSQSEKALLEAILLLKCN